MSIWPVDNRVSVLEAKVHALEAKVEALEFNLTGLVQKRHTRWPARFKAATAKSLHRARMWVEKL